MTVTAPSLHHHCPVTAHCNVTALSNHHHCTVTALSNHHHYTVTVLSNYHHYTVTALSNHHHYTVTALSKHPLCTVSHCTITALSLHCQNTLSVLSLYCHCTDNAPTMHQHCTIMYPIIVPVTWSVTSQSPCSHKRPLPTPSLYHSLCQARPQHRRRREGDKARGVIPAERPLGANSHSKGS